MSIETQKYIFCRDSYTSEGGYSSFDNTYTYLNRFPVEKDEFFNDRKSNTILENIYKPMINLFYSPIASKSIDIEINTNNKDLKNVIKNTKMLSKSNASLLDINMYDIAIYSITVGFNELEEPDLTFYPEILNIFPGDVKELKFNGLEIYEGLYYEYKNYNNVRIPIKIEYDNNIFIKITLAWIDENGHISLEDLGENKRITEFDDMLYGVLNKVGEELGSTPYSYGLALSQLKMYNQDSDRRNILRKNGYPILMIASDKELEEIVTGNNNGLQVGSEDSFPQLLESTLDGVVISGEILEADKEFVYKTHTNGLLSSNMVYNSATQSAIASKAFQNTVNVYYTIYKEIIEDMIDRILFIYDIPTTYSITYPDIDINETSMIDEINKII